MKKSRKPTKSLTRPKQFEPYHQRFSSWWNLDSIPTKVVTKKKKRPRRLKKLTQTMRVDSGSDTSVDESMLQKLSLMVSEEDMAAELDEAMTCSLQTSPGQKSPGKRRYFFVDSVNEYWDTKQPPEINMSQDVPSGDEQSEEEKYMQDSLDVSIQNATSFTDVLLSPQSLSTMHAPHPPPRLSDGFKRRSVPVNMPVDPSKVYIINSDSSFLQRALDARGWKQADNKRTTYFAFKWVDKADEFDYRIMRPGQMLNFFPDSKEAITQAGLIRSFDSCSRYGFNRDLFFLRSYDLSTQLEEFKEDFNQTMVFNIVKKHAEYFSQNIDEYNV